MATPALSRRQALALAGAAVAAPLAGALAPTAARAADPQAPAGLREGVFFPLGAPLQRITAVDVTARPDAELVFLACLQGLAARTSTTPHLYLTRPNSVQQLWLDDLRRRGVPVDDANGIWELAAAQHAQRFVRYSAADGSLSVATTAAGVLGAVAVEDSLVAAATAHGLRQVADVRGRTDAWSLRTYASRLRRDFAIEQKNSFSYQLRDLGTMAAAMTYYDGNSALRDRIGAALRTDSAIVGWGDASHGENTFVAPSSQQGNYLVAADWADNLSTLSSAPSGPLRQHRTAAVQPRAGQHYVAFVVTDGDNLQWMTTSFALSSSWWANPRRRQVRLGWGMPPSMVDLAPSALGWYYGDAGEGDGADQFVVGPSGAGYCYPSMEPAPALQEQTARLNRAMQTADVDVVQILDFDALATPGLWDAYTIRPQINGLIYLEYSRYDREAGRTVWSHDKPVVSARHMLWAGLDGADEASVTAALNAASTDPTSVDGYSIVAVHAWSKTVDDVLTVVDGLADHVQVACPADLIAGMRATVHR